MLPRAECITISAIAVSMFIIRSKMYDPMPAFKEIGFVSWDGFRLISSPFFAPVPREIILMFYFLFILFAKMYAYKAGLLQMIPPSTNWEVMLNAFVYGSGSK